MAILKTSVDDDTKKRFAELARSEGMNESELLRLYVMAILSDADNSASLEPVVVDKDNAKSRRHMIRLPSFLLDAVESRAMMKSMAPSRWVTALVQTHLMTQPVMTEKEIMALQASNRELAAIGRNLNQIAKSLNINFSETDKVRLTLIEALGDLLKKNQITIRALVRASQDSWGITNDDH